MKLSDFVASFLAKEGIKHVFAVSGGASVHLIQSIADTSGIEFVCPAHEQAGAMAADAYSRVTGNLGAAIATSGPGATNLLTGVACAFYDSIPAIYITGQVATFRSRHGTGVRQIGFQETDTVDIFRPITKYAVRVDDPQLIRYELEKACYLAREGRPGPVLIDLPDDLQRAEISPDDIARFSPPVPAGEMDHLDSQIDQLLVYLESARRPVLIVGAGVRLAKSERDLKETIHKLGFPVAPTWAAADILPSHDPLCVGTFGTHGTRYANFAVQNADLVVALGSRLDTKATGSPVTTFARSAKKVLVDIDATELRKFERSGLRIDLQVNADVGQFLRLLNFRLDGRESRDYDRWLKQINVWKTNYPVVQPDYYREDGVNPYVLVKTLSEHSGPDDVFVVDTGCALAWMMQGFSFKEGQRLLHDWNNTAMGWAVPASIAASLALNRRPITCVTGDGSLLMNIQELATIVRYKLPIRIVLVNNHGYSMIRQTQEQWLSSRYLASSEEGGLACPDFVEVAKAFGFDAFTLTRSDDVSSGILRMAECRGPVLCDVDISPQHRVVPQVKFGRPNEDPEPLLPRPEFFRNMLVPPLEVSRQES